MTIADRPQFVTIPGSAVTVGVGINVPFDVQARSEVAVLYGDDLPAYLDVEYTVTLAPDYRSAVVTPLNGLVEKAAGGNITIRSALPYTQGWAVPINSRLAEADVQRTTDRDVLRDRQLFEELDHGIKAYFNNPAIVSVEGRRVIDVGIPVAGSDAARYDNVQALNTRIDDIMASGGVSVVRDTATVLSAAAVPEAQSPDYYRVAGYSSVGDGGLGIWKFEPDIAGVPASLKFNNGAKVFINRSSKVRPEEAGARGLNNPGDAATNVIAFNAVLNSTEHSWICLDQPGIYQLNAALARTLVAQQGLVIEMHPEAELSFSAASDAINPMLSLTGALGAQTLITADVLEGATTISVASTVGFAIGQGVKLASNKLFDPFESLTKEAEIGIVEAVTGATSITLLEPVNADYLLVDVPTLKPITFAGRSRLIGGRLRGNPAVAMSGFQVQYMLGLSVEGTHFVDFDSRAVAFRDSLGGHIDGIDVYGDETPDTGYGVSMWGAARGLSVTHNDFRRCRHAFTTNNSSGDGGIPQDATVFDNRVHGTAQDFNDALDTHCAARGIRFLYNWVYDSKGGGIHAQCPDVDIIGNRIIRPKGAGVVWVNESRYDGHAVIADNTIADSLDRGIFAAGASHGDGSGIARLNISRNEIFRVALEGIHLEDSTTGARSVRVDINNNYIDGYAISALSLEEVDQFNLRNNTSKNPATPGVSAVKLVNCTIGNLSSERHRLTLDVDTTKRGISMLSACSTISIGGETYLDDTGGTTGIAIAADDTCSGITVERSVQVRGFLSPRINLGTSLTNHDKVLWEPIVLTVADDQVTNFRFSPVTAYVLVHINARSSDGLSPHGSFWANGGGSPTVAGIGSSLTNCNFAVGALAPGAGADNKFTISVNNDSTIHFSNRTGVSLTLDIQRLTG